MNDEEYEKLISDLLSNPNTNKIGQIIKSLIRGTKNFKEAMKNLQESLDYLRVCIKYQSFDLEATRRENEKLIKIIKKHGLENEIQ